MEADDAVAKVGAEAVLLGARLHDTGEALRPAELDSPGRAHESAAMDRCTVFTPLDDVFERVAGGGEERLARSRVG